MRSPTRRTALAACAALLLVTAGCSGGTTPANTATSETTDGNATPCTYPPATTTTDAAGTWSPNASVGQYPPGVADNGTLGNASALVDAHFDATANQSTEFTVGWEGPESDYVRRLVQAPNQSQYYSTFDGEFTPGAQKTEKVYVNGSRSYFQYSDDIQNSQVNQTIYRVSQNTRIPSDVMKTDDLVGPRSSLERFLDRGNYTVNGTVERGGQTFVKLTADEGTPLGTLESFTAYDGTALVTPDGVVYEVDEFFGAGANGSVEKRYEGAVRFDTDVDWCGAPSWTDNVPQLSLSIVEDGHAVEIRNTGGAAVPANTSFDIFGANEPARNHAPIRFREEVNGTVTTDAPLEPGDAVYVTAGADGSASSFALHDEPGRGEYTFGYSGLIGWHGNVGYRLATGFDLWENE